MLGSDSLAQLPLASGSLYSYTPLDPESALYPFMQTVISEYANSPILLQLIHDLTVYFDPSANLNMFFDMIWNIDTARGYGLDVWGRIVGVDRVLHIAAPGDFLGFKEATDADTFGHGVFWAGVATTSNYALSDSAFRILILAKALANITDGSIPSINQILINLFPGGNPHVTDGLNMTMTYTFARSLSPVELAIITSSGVIPKPAGVSVTVVHT